MDQQTYAVKKTVLRVPSDSLATVNEEMNRMLLEARLCAAISNPHIIRYNNSWIEVTELRPELQDLTAADPQKNSQNSHEVELNSPFIEFAHSDDSPSDCESEGEISDFSEEVQKKTQSDELL